MDKKTRLSYLLAIALFLAFGTVSLVAIAKNDNAKAQSQSKSKTDNLKNFEKADKTKGTTNSQLHKVKSEEVTKTLKAEAKKQKNAGETEVGEQIEEVAIEQEQIQPETVEAIEEVESRGKFKTFIVGEDYRNLGQLRSSLVNNRNEIRKLTKSLTQVQTTEEKNLIETQLMTLTQERERIKNVIVTNESSFSLFGWVSRFLSGYDEQAPINETEEAQLIVEVETAIETSDPISDSTIPVVPVTTIEAETVPVEQISN